MELKREQKERKREQALDHKWQVNNLKREFKQDSFFTQQNPIKQQVIK